MDSTAKIRLCDGLFGKNSWFPYPEVSFKTYKKTGSDQNEQLWIQQAGSRKLICEATGADVTPCRPWEIKTRWTIHTLNLVPFQGMKHGKGCTCTEIWFCCTVVLKTLADSCGIYNWGTAEALFKGDGYRSYLHPTGRRHLFAHVG